MLCSEKVVECVRWNISEFAKAFRDRREMRECWDDFACGLAKLHNFIYVDGIHEVDIVCCEDLLSARGGGGGGAGVC